ncbi:hypothetical protein WJX81_006856 [Elliptochloris bilobata]|uniref:Uncharacterized protein n=1 Tax=Elliptochloris bilobata TaxID=381761 RepID=A0AAW1QY52_9CHLO
MVPDTLSTTEWAEGVFLLGTVAILIYLMSWRWALFFVYRLQYQRLLALSRKSRRWLRRRRLWPYRRHAGTLRAPAFCALLVAIFACLAAIQAVWLGVLPDLWGCLPQLAALILVTLSLRGNEDVLFLLLGATCLTTAHAAHAAPTGLAHAGPGPAASSPAASDDLVPGMGAALALASVLVVLRSCVRQRGDSQGQELLEDLHDLGCRLDANDVAGNELHADVASAANARQELSLAYLRWRLRIAEAVIVRLKQSAPSLVQLADLLARVERLEADKARLGADNARLAAQQRAQPAAEQPAKPVPGDTAEGAGPPADAAAHDVPPAAGFTSSQPSAAAPSAGAPPMCEGSADKQPAPAAGGTPLASEPWADGAARAPEAALPVSQGAAPTAAAPAEGAPARCDSTAEQSPPDADAGESPLASEPLADGTARAPEAALPVSQGAVSKAAAPAESAPAHCDSAAEQTAPASDEPAAAAPAAACDAPDGTAGGEVSGEQPS